MRLVHRVGDDGDGQRLDKFVSESVNLSRTLAQQMIVSGLVMVDGRVRKPNYRLRPGEAVSVDSPPLAPPGTTPERIPLDIVYEDGAILVVNKTAGMVVHPSAGHRSGTLVNAVLGHTPDLVVGNEERPGIVHRLDRDTSGLIVIAKQDAALKDLQRQFSSREVHKVYLALVHGQLEVPEGRIEAPLARDPHDRKRFAVLQADRSREATTIFRVAERLAKWTLLQVEPQTGRTHQIRVHLAFIKHPVVGDRSYGRGHGDDLNLDRQFLHAWRLGFAHPTSGERVQFSAPLPNDLASALVRAGGDPTRWE